MTDHRDMRDEAPVTETNSKIDEGTKSDEPGMRDEPGMGDEPGMRDEPAKTDALRDTEEPRTPEEPVTSAEPDRSGALAGTRQAADAEAEAEETPGTDAEKAPATEAGLPPAPHPDPTAREDASPGEFQEGPEAGENAPAPAEEAVHPPSLAATPSLAEEARRSFTPDREPRKLDPRVRSYWWVRGAINTVILGGIAFIVDLGVFFPRILPSGWPTGLAASVFTGILLTWAVFIPPIAYERWRFALREGDVWIRRGILIRSVSVIPFRRLQFVDTAQGPIARIFSLAELVVHTAAPGTSGQIPGLDAEEAESLRERLAHLEPTDDEPI